MFLTPRYNINEVFTHMTRSHQQLSRFADNGVKTLKIRLKKRPRKGRNGGAGDRNSINVE